MFLLSRFYQGIEKYQFAAVCSREVVGRPSRDVADSSGTKRHAATANAQASTTLQHMTNDVLVVVTDLFWVQALLGTETD